MDANWFRTAIESLQRSSPASIRLPSSMSTPTFIVLAA